MRCFLLIFATFSLLACNPREERAAAPRDDGPAPSEARTAKAPKLDGEWRVAAIDGTPTGAGEAMTARFAGGKAIISAGCVRRAFAYTQKRNVVSFAADPAGSSNCEGRGASAEQATASDALQQASIVIFNKDGSEANLSGAGGNLTLRRS